MDEFDEIDAGLGSGDEFDAIDRQGSGGATEGISPWLVGAGVAAAGLAGLALKNPQAAKKAYDAALSLRYIPMLSGLAVPKSLMGNVGAAGMAGLERKSFDPLKQLFSRQTAREFVGELRNPTARGTGHVAQQAGRYNPFGRVMGAADVATQNALQRAGLTAGEAAEHTLQSPVPAKYAKAMGTPLGRLMIPFQRTGFNQLFGGLKATGQHPGIAAGAAAAGGAVGAETEDLMTPGIVSPLAGRYGLPFILGAAVGKRLSGGTRHEAERVGFGLSPTSDEAMLGPFMDPTKQFRPSILSVLKYLGIQE